MSDNKGRKCRDCGASDREVRISSRGRCGNCWRKRLSDAVNQMQVKKGPLYEKWRANHRTAIAKQLAKGPR